MAKGTKKNVVVHYCHGYGYTSCGVDTYFWSEKEIKEKTRKTWATVAKNKHACKRCLAVKAKMDTAKALGSGGTKTTKKAAKVGCCVG